MVLDEGQRLRAKLFRETGNQQPIALTLLLRVFVSLALIEDRIVPVVVKTAGRDRDMPILARHHIVVEVGSDRYDVDVMGFVTRLQPATVDGSGPARYILTGSGTEREPAVIVQVLEWSQSQRRGWRAVVKLGGNKQKWEAYWRQLGIVNPSPGGAADKEAKISLALGRRRSDESSCATSAKEDSMTNAEKPDTAAKEGITVAHGAPTGAEATRKAGHAKAGPKARKRAAAKPRAAGRTTRTKAATNSAKKAAAASATKPRTDSKGAQILELIGRAKGATLGEVMQATSWQAHSVRGFLSTAAKKHRLKIVSTRNEAGERTYKLVR
jgi:hypothetical protein